MRQHAAQHTRHGAIYLRAASVPSRMTDDGDAFDNSRSRTTYLPISHHGEGWRATGRSVPPRTIRASDGIL